MENKIDNTENINKAELNLKSKKLREQPIGKLLFSMSMPAIISMLVQALYNVVDAIFIGWYKGYGLIDGNNPALEAVTLALPAQMIIIAFAVGIGVGTNVQVSKKLGEGKREEAQAIAKTGIFLAIIASVVFAILGQSVVKPFVSLFNANPEVAKYTVSYLKIVTTLSFGIFIEIACSKVLQGTGNMKIPMISQLIGAGVNIILDPIFIFGLDMGIEGAAIATVIGQMLAMCFVLTVFAIKKHDVSISPKGFKLQGKNIWAIAVIGFPTLLMNLLAAVITTVFNFFTKTIIHYDNAAIIYGVYFRLQSFVFMPVFGLMQGTLPILSYNYGLGDKKRYNRCVRLTLTISAAIMVFGFIIFQATPGLLLQLFGAKNLLDEGKLALRIISICFIPAAFSIVIITLFQSLGRGLSALAMSLSRQLLLLLPVLIILGLTAGKSSIWFAFPIAEITTLSVFSVIAIKSVKKAFLTRTAWEGAKQEDKL